MVSPLRISYVAGGTENEPVSIGKSAGPKAL